SHVHGISSVHGSVIASSSVRITTLVSGVGVEQRGWDFYNPVLGPPSEPYYPGPECNQLDFVFDPPPTDQWGHNAPGLFVWDPSGEDLPGTLGTRISSINSYFRYSFVLNASPIGASYRFRHVIDDG